LVWHACCSARLPSASPERLTTRDAMTGAVATKGASALVSQQQGDQRAHARMRPDWPRNAHARTHARAHAASAWCSRLRKTSPSDSRSNFSCSIRADDILCLPRAAQCRPAQPSASRRSVLTASCAQRDRALRTDRTGGLPTRLSAGTHAHTAHARTHCARTGGQCGLYRSSTSLSADTHAHTHARTHARTVHAQAASAGFTGRRRA
jgi:hypothetical protein